MQKKLFILFVGMVLSMIVYAVWQTASYDNKVSKVLIPKNVDEIEEEINKTKTMRTTVVVPDVKTDTSIENKTIDRDITIDKEIEAAEKRVDIDVGTPEKMQAQTQEVYDALVPDDYEETIEEAQSAFEALDEHVAKVDARITEEQLGIEERILEESPLEEEALSEEQESEDRMDLPIAEDLAQ